MPLNYSAGDTIRYIAFGNVEREVTVDYREEDVKNGEPGFVGVIISGSEKGTGAWGYDDQIVEVL